MDVLLTFTGFHDPFSKGLIGEEEQPGPILSLVAARCFEKVYLFSTPAMQGISEDTKQAIADLNQEIKVEVLAVSLDDPTDYQQILSGLRRVFHNIQDSNPCAAFHIAVASGTPQMHACWMLLAAAGEIPAHILNVRPPKFVTKERPLIEEINFTSPAFPVIRFEQREPPALAGAEMESVPPMALTRPLPEVIWSHGHGSAERTETIFSGNLILPAIDTGLGPGLGFRRCGTYCGTHKRGCKRRPGRFFGVKRNSSCRCWFLAASRPCPLPSSPESAPGRISRAPFTPRRDGVPPGAGSPRFPRDPPGLVRADKRDLSAFATGRAARRSPS